MITLCGFDEITELKGYVLKLCKIIDKKMAPHRNINNNLLDAITFYFSFLISVIQKLDSRQQIVLKETSR